MFSTDAFDPYALIISFIVIPIIVIYLEQYKIVKKVGAVLICYLIGAAIGNFGLFPDTTETYNQLLNATGKAFVPLKEIRQLLAEGTIVKTDAIRNSISFIQDTSASVSVLLALPLILFSMDIKKWFKQANHAFSSLLIGLFTVLVMIFIGYWLFKDGIPGAGDVGGLLVGVYTGGTPNMAAIKTALEIPNEIYIMTHTYEMLLGGIYLVFIFSIGQKVFLTFLPPYKRSVSESTDFDEKSLQEEYESYKGFFSKKTILPLLAAFGLAVLILGVSFLVGQLVPADYSATTIVLLVTALGVGFSFVPKINNIKMTYQLGMYIILIFCIAVASMADAGKLANISPNLFYFVGFAMFGSHILHALIAKFFNIDADTVIISGSALICSPPFVPVVAASLKNRDVIMTGLAVGIAGYAVGNFLGVLVAGILNTWM
ncbi:MAG: DUF819 family protein [Bacteroidota bacterium]